MPHTEPLGILLLSGSHERAHFACMMAAGAAALGRRVVLFCSNAGCRALLVDWSRLTEIGRDAALRARGMAGLGELREQSVELGVRMIACEAGLRSEALSAAELMPEVEVAGIATFLEQVAGGQIITL